jgi:heterodisulfide reductase subunit C
MAWMICTGSCVICGDIFDFNPDTVPSVRVTEKDGELVPDPAGPRCPICRRCVEAGNRERELRGMEPIVVPEGAYGAQEVQ